MTRAILVRVGHAVLSTFFLLVVVFLMVRLTGDPINFLTPPEFSQEQREMVRQDLGLDKPITTQFWLYLNNLAHGDLGSSFRTGVPVRELLAQRMPATLIMGGASTLLMLLFGLPLAVYSAYRRGGWFDRGVRGFAAFGQSAPDFWIGLILILIFAVNLKWLPAGGYGTPQHVILPAVTLAFAAIAGLIRLLRSSMIEVLASDHVRFRRMSGLSETKILWKHGLRNAGLTTLSYMGVVLAGLFTGSVLVETIFVWPGMGRLFVESIQGRDFPVIQGVMLVFAAAFIGVNLIVDLLYAVLNPKLR